MKIFSRLFLAYSVCVLLAGYVNVGTFISILISIAFIYIAQSNNNNMKRILKYILTVYFSILGLFIIFLYSNVKYESNNPKNVNGILVLGSGLNFGETPSKEGKLRLNKAIKYANKFPHLPIYLTGGKGIDEKLAESTAFKKYLLDNGISVSRIHTEDFSTSTKENFYYTKELLKKEGNNYDTFFLVTSDFHMLRAKLIAKHFDINVIPVATATNIFTLPINLFREEIAFIKTLIFDLN